MHKELMLLGLLRRGPMYGYELHRIVQAHGEIYSDMKKANVYYLLDRLAGSGCLTVQAEPGTRGARGERLVYTITEVGRERFGELLREVLRSYEPEHNGVAVAVNYLSHLTTDEALDLLGERQRVVAERRAQVAAELGDPAAHGPLRQLAADHLLSKIDAELDWIARSLAYLHEAGWTGATKEDEDGH